MFYDHEDGWRWNTVMLLFLSICRSEENKQDEWIIVYVLKNWFRTTVCTQQTSGFYDLILYFFCIKKNMIRVKPSHAKHEIRDKMGQKTHKNKIWKVTPKMIVLWCVNHNKLHKLCLALLCWIIEWTKNYTPIQNV